MVCYGLEDDEDFYHGVPAAKEEAIAAYTRSMLREIAVESSVELEAGVRAEMEPALVLMHALRG